ncbi:MAG: hypothetical protein R3325_10140 [Thermoanaerobaculia bacterium]|nr:hypothetical protein [Thermoanaerobaculia bacterium]
MNELPRSTPWTRYLRFLAWLGLLALGAVAAGYLPTRNLGGAAAVRAMTLGCGLSLFGSVLGSLPVLAAAARPGGPGTSELLGSLALRFFVVVAGSGAVVLASLAPPRPFLIWVAISYVLFLIADVLYSVREQRSA